MSSEESETPSFEPRRVPDQRPGPAGGKRDRNRRMRTQALCEAGLTLFLERGIEAVTVDEIARAANTAKGNFYRYLRDKEDLVAALLAPLEEAFRDALADCEQALETARDVSALTSAYMKLALALVQAILQHQEVVRLYLQESRAPSEGSRKPLGDFERWMTARAIELTRVAHEHELLSKIPPEVSALAVMGAAERLLLAHLRDGLFQNQAQIAASLVVLVMEGIS